MARNPLFRASALDRLSSPEQLDERLQVVPPRTWFALGALAALLLAGGVWSVFGHIPLRVSGEGVFQAALPSAPRELTVFVSAADAHSIQPGRPAHVRVSGADPLIGEVRRIAAHTTPRASLLQALDHEATVDRLTRSGPVVSVTIVLRPPADFPSGTRCSVDLVTGETRPVALLFGR
jgi:hypothetical protein